MPGLQLAVCLGVRVCVNHSGLRLIHLVVDENMCSATAKAAMYPFILRYSGVPGSDGLRTYIVIL